MNILKELRKAINRNAEYCKKGYKINTEKSLAFQQQKIRKKLRKQSHLPSHQKE